MCCNEKEDREPATYALNTTWKWVLSHRITSNCRLQLNLWSLAWHSTVCGTCFCILCDFFLKNLNSASQLMDSEIRMCTQFFAHQKRYKQHGSHNSGNQAFMRKDSDSYCFYASPSNIKIEMPKPIWWGMYAKSCSSCTWDAQAENSLCAIPPHDSFRELSRVVRQYLEPAEEKQLTEGLAQAPWSCCVWAFWTVAASKIWQTPGVNGPQEAQLKCRWNNPSQESNRRPPDWKAGDSSTQPK